jgi:hypothetical protein
MAAAIWTPGSGGVEVLSSKLIKEIALSDQATALLVTVGAAYFRVYAPFVVTAIYASLFVVSSSGIVTVDINRNGVSILSTKLTIDVGEKDSLTAAVPYVITGTTLFSIGEEISLDIDVAGTGAKGLIVYFAGNDV